MVLVFDLRQVFKKSTSLVLRHLKINKKIKYIAIIIKLRNKIASQFGKISIILFFMAIDINEGISMAITGFMIH